MKIAAHGSCGGPNRSSSLAGFSAAAIALLLLSAAASRSAAESFASCAIVVSNDLAYTDGTYDAFPLDISEPIWEWPSDRDDPDAVWGGWCYANEEGRVRGRVITGNDIETPISARVWLTWLGWFERTPGASDPSFTINPSHLLLEAFPSSADEEEAKKALANMLFAVRVRSERGDGRVFEHRSEMHGQPSEETFHFDHETDGDEALYSRTGKPMHPATRKADVVETPSIATYELPGYTQEINLDRYGIGIGDRYAIIYDLEVEAGEFAIMESRAEAFLGDPLDAGTGFALSTVHEPVAAPAASCAAVDPGRFMHDADGSATDARTGLMWQRCPLGYVLDDAGTPADPADDACVAEADADRQLGWQAALQAAADDTLGGHDWRAPNAKELESLIEACPGPALADPVTFPGLPASGFWSATPQFDDGAAPRRAWQLDFGDGDLRPVSRLATAYLLPVRDTGDGPTAPGVSVAAGNASVAEGDSGTTVLSLPVGLSAPLAADVSVDYVVRGLDAAEGVDFTATAGTLTIPAGDTIAHVDVQVMGDTEVEHSELVRLELDNLSGASWLRQATGTGTIIDDEPIFQPAATAEVPEGSANHTVDIVVQLDRPAVETISIDFATSDDTATAGADYLAAAGTVVIQPGDSEGTLPLTIVGDVTAESSERLNLTFDNATAATLINAPFVMVVTIVDDDGPGSYSALNDTGVTECATGDLAVLTCPQAGYPGQDAEFGRDVTAANPADGALGFSFLKRDAAGDELADQGGTYAEGPWDCVEDQVTGLLWEVKSDQPGDLRYYDDTFTWYNSSGGNDGGDAGTPNGGVCADGVNCDTEKYVTAVNAAGLCGFNDWRLASADELFSIAWLSLESARGVETAYFPNHFSPPDGRGYWSATPSAVDPQSALRVRMDAGVSGATTISPAAKDHTHRIRLVRGGSQL